MKKLVNKRTIFIVLSIVILIVSVLPVFLSEKSAITVNSAPAIAFGVGSVIYAVFAFVMKNEQNLFVLGRNWLFFAFLRSMRGDTQDVDSDEYKNEFALSAFIFCASIPVYIPLAFFAKEFYSAFSSVLTVTILRILFTIVLVLIPRIVREAQNRRLENLKGETDKKEQERNESMGKWK